MVLDVVEVAVVHVGPAAVDLQPRPAVEHALAPAADFEDFTGPADVPQRLRVEVSAVVDRKVPVAVRPVRALGPRTAQRDGRYARQPAETLRDVGGKDDVVHTRKLTGHAGPGHQVFAEGSASGGRYYAPLWANW